MATQPTTDTADDGDAPVDAGKRRRGNNRGGESRHSQRRIVAVEKQAEALEYRKMGLSYAQIADKCGFNCTQTAWNAVEAALKRTLQDAADDVRKMELGRLDALFIPQYGNAQRGDVMALNACLNIMARRARLLGLDAPEKRELTGPNGKPLQPTTIVIGGPGEAGEPEVAGTSVVPPAGDDSIGAPPK